MTTCAYVKQIEITIRKLATCLDWNDTVTACKIQEVFYAGLDESTRLEIARYSDRTYNSILECLFNLDTLLIKRFNRKYNSINVDIENFKTLKRYERSSDREFIRKDISKKLNSYDIKKKRKYCSFHKSNTHCDDECSAKFKNNKDSNSKTFTVREPQ
ncbi:hypothetical protein DMUE_3011 [Dictyocoela muelleri]|nr:hypothetical protein DMUE_3011 [Dictyocoela muelleri]